MCSNCGNDTEHTDPWTPDMHRALELIRELYATPDGIMGGALHCALDDGNLEDGSPCLNVDYERGEEYWEDPASMRRICDELLALLLAMTEAQRRTTVNTFHDGHYGKAA